MKNPYAPFDLTLPDAFVTVSKLIRVEVEQDDHEFTATARLQGVPILRVTRFSFDGAEAEAETQAHDDLYWAVVDALEDGDAA
jgi:hypothetical protein